MSNIPEQIGVTLIELSLQWNELRPSYYNVREQSNVDDGFKPLVKFQNSSYYDLEEELWSMLWNRARRKFTKESSCRDVEFREKYVKFIFGVMRNKVVMRSDK